MKQFNIVLFFLLLCDIALSYQDLDIDGVDDSVDRCLETPFDELVDEYGCSKSEKSSTNYGNLRLKIGTDIFVDSRYENDSSWNLYADYQYNSWDISISNSRSITHSSYGNSYSDEDIYISIGDSFELDKDTIRLSIGTKIAGDIDSNRKYKNRKNMDREHAEENQNSNRNLSRDRDNDYFGSFDYNHIINEKQNILLYYGYTLSGDSQCINYQNFSSFSIGMGYLFTPKWYSTVSYDYIGSIYRDSDASSSIEWFNSYEFTKRISASIGYSYALDDISYNNTLSLNLGFIF